MYVYGNVKGWRTFLFVCYLFGFFLLYICFIWLVFFKNQKPLCVSMATSKGENFYQKKKQEFFMCFFYLVNFFQKPKTFMYAYDNFKGWSTFFVISLVFFYQFDLFSFFFQIKNLCVSKWQCRRVKNFSNHFIALNLYTFKI